MTLPQLTLGHGKGMLWAQLSPVLNTKGTYAFLIVMATHHVFIRLSHHGPTEIGITWDLRLMNIDSSSRAHRGSPLRHAVHKNGLLINWTNLMVCSLVLPARDRNEVRTDLFMTLKCMLFIFMLSLQ